jgi:hypothetical protein
MTIDRLIGGQRIFRCVAEFDRFSPVPAPRTGGFAPRSRFSTPASMSGDDWQASAEDFSDVPGPAQVCSALV